jgi:hypothetical protein
VCKHCTKWAAWRWAAKKKGAKVATKAAAVFFADIELDDDKFQKWYMYVGLTT